LVDVPLCVVGGGPRGNVEYRYRIGTFTGRVVPWSLENDPELVVRLRIPAEKFGPGEDLLLEVVAKDPPTVLWKKCWKAAWQGTTPTVESTGSDRDIFDPGSDGRPRYYRSRR
jgi:hypothetical protein